MNIYKEIEKLVVDNRSGSSALLVKLLDILEDYHTSAENYSIQDLKNILNQLIENFSDFAIYFHFYRAFNNRLKVLEGYRFPANEIRKEILQFLVSYKNRWKDVNDRISNSVVNNIDWKNKKVLLHSNSSTIRSVFNILSKKGIYPDIIQTISYPAKEGILQAKFLARKDFKVTLITDSSIGIYVPSIDYAILGADAILHDTFTNKTGSLLIAIACLHFKKKLFVLADSRKKIDIKTTSRSIISGLKEGKEKPAKEIYSTPNKNIYTSNRYFEEIPVSLVSGFFFEE